MDLFLTACVKLLQMIMIEVRIQNRNPLGSDEPYL